MVKPTLVPNLSDSISISGSLAQGLRFGLAATSNANQCIAYVVVPVEEPATLFLC